MSSFTPLRQLQVLMVWPGEEARSMSSLLAGRLGDPTGVELVTTASEGFRNVQRYRPTVVMVSTHLEGNTAGDVFIAAIRQVPELAETTVIAILEGDQRQLPRKYEILQCSSIVTSPVDIHLFFENIGRYLKLDYRHTRRIPLEIPVSLKSESGIHEGTSIDISISGIKIDTDASLEVGMEVLLTLHLEDGSVIGPILSTIVRREDPSMYGIRFNSMDHQTTLRLEHFLLPLDHGGEHANG